MQERFEPNFLVQIDQRKFTEGLLERLCSQGYDTEKLLKGFPQKFGEDLFLSPNDLLRWILLSLFLCKTFQIAALPAGAYRFRVGDTPGQLIASACGATHQGYERSVSAWIPHHRDEAGPLDFAMLERFATTIEPYYRPIIWRHDPVSVALSCFWAFLFSRFPDQAYLSLVTILEALLSTGTAEIAHQLSERVAVLIGRSSKERPDIYRQTKKLYNVRSRITHGDLEPKKGPIMSDTTFMSAKMTMVSIPILTELAQYATAVLRSVLESPELMSAMDKKKIDRKRSLDEFFLARLFS